MTKQHRSSGVFGKLSLRSGGIIGLLLIFSGLVVGAHLWRKTAPAVGALLPAAAVRSSVQTGTVSVVLGPDGFAPASVTHASGTFSLAVENQSGAEEITLRLKHDGSGQVGEWTVPSGTQTWNQTVELAPGGYMLSEANNPAWLFHITVQ